MLGGIFDKNKIEEKLHIFSNKITEENFWKNKLSAQKILKEKKFFDNILNDFKSTVSELENLEQLLELAIKENEVLVIKDCEKKNSIITWKVRIGLKC